MVFALYLAEDDDFIPVILQGSTKVGRVKKGVYCVARALSLLETHLTVFLVKQAVSRGKEGKQCAYHAPLAHLVKVGRPDAPNASQELLQMRQGWMLASDVKQVFINR